MRRPPALPPRPSIAAGRRTEYVADPFQEPAVQFMRAKLAAGEQPLENLVLAYRLEGVLDVEALKRSFQVLLARHEPLRTVFPDEDDPPLARVLPPDAEVALTRVEGSVETAVELAQRERRSPFDFRSEVLVRGILVAIAAEEHILLVSVHHVVCDGVESLALLTRELGEAYRAFEAGREPELPPLPFAYSDFAVAHRAYLTPEVQEATLDYWRDHLPPDSPLPPLELPRSTERREAHALGRVAAADVSSSLRSRIDELCRAERLTTFMVVASALLVVLRSFAREDRVGLTMPTFNAWSGLDRLVGHFGNLGVIWTDVEAATSCRSLVRRIRELTVHAVAHADMPFENVVQALYGDAATEPPYVFFSIRPRNPHGPWRSERLSATPFSLPYEGKARFHPGLRIQGFRDRGELTLVCEYTAGEYDPPVVQAVLDRTIEVLDVVARDLELPVGRALATLESVV